MKRLEIFGATPSPYTQKMLSLLRYKRIPYNIHWGDTRGRLESLNLELPKPVLLPVILFENEDKGLVATTDSTPMIRRLENEHPDRKVIPDDPALAFINYLLEDFGDEWITKYMFHYRWHCNDDADKAGTILPIVEFPRALNDEEHQQMKTWITERQTERLWVVGSSNETAELIDQSFKNFLQSFNELLKQQRFLLGDKPSSADFAFYGQISQLVRFDPTPREICHQMAPRVVAWVEIMDDLSGLDAETLMWTDLKNCSDSLKAILAEFGKMYAPLLLENAKAVEEGLPEWSVDIDGSSWKQKTFSYQAKCLNWIRDEFNGLSDADQQKVRSFLADSGCEQIL